MRKYETTIVFKPTSSQEELEKTLSGLVSLVQDNGGILERQSSLERRPIHAVAKKMNEGYLGSLGYLLAEEKLGELEKKLKQEESVFRFVTIQRRASEHKASSRQIRHLTEEQKEEKPSVESIDQKLSEIFKEEA